MTPPVGLFSLRGLPLARRALVFVCFRAISDALASLADSKQTWRAGGQRAECKRLSHPDELEPPQPGRLVVCEPARDRWEPNWRSIQLELGASHDQRGGGDARKLRLSVWLVGGRLVHYWPICFASGPLMLHSQLV